MIRSLDSHKTTSSSAGQDEISDVIRALETIIAEMRHMEIVVDVDVFGRRRDSARNLLHYLALRRHDVRSLQERLELLGLSSLGRSEGHVLYNAEAVLRVLRELSEGRTVETLVPESSITPKVGRAILHRNADSLLGPVREGREVRIMVTMPTEAATDYKLVRDLVINGMDLMRINCAHDTKKEWLQMIDNLRRAEKESGLTCRIMMDIAGPKVRTSPLTPGPMVIKWRPRRDSFGRVLSPAKIWLTSRERPCPAPGTADASLQCPEAWLRKLTARTRITFDDTRGAHRSIRPVRRTKGGWWGESRKTAYVSSDTKLVAASGIEGAMSVRVDGIPCREDPIVLKVGEKLILTGKGGLGTPAERDPSGKVLKPAKVSCTLPEALHQVKVGDKVWLDDGKAGGNARAVGGGEVEVEITSAAHEGTKLLADKGINFPDTDLRLPSLTRKDREDIKFIAKYADLVGYSFIRLPSDIESLRARLKREGGREIGIVLKIETRRAFEELPRLLLALMQEGESGVMIARGDLAVECGYERLAEVQEEILWLCEAAHMPAIWATQVLEGMAKNGFPTRAEVTDAAMGQRAECVMLNKGPYIVDVVRALENILRRMQEHQLKKSSMLKHLRIADAFVKTERAP